MKLSLLSVLTLFFTLFQSSSGSAQITTMIYTGNKPTEQQISACIGQNLTEQLLESSFNSVVYGDESQSPLNIPDTVCVFNSSTSSTIFKKFTRTLNSDEINEYTKAGKYVILIYTTLPKKP